MRTQEEMLELFTQVAKDDERIRLSVLEGSLTNPSIPKDKYQDYDVTFFVTEKESYLKNDDWLAIFGKVIYMQKPEMMTLFPSEFPKMFSYLMYLDDGVKIDLSLVLVEGLEWYLSESDGLVESMIDKDQLLIEMSPATDKIYWLKQPTQAEFNDCLNEFWHVSTYVSKGLVRDELLFAMDHLNENIRKDLLRMMSWHVGNHHGYHQSLGKNYKFINNFLTEEEWAEFLLTFDLSTKEKMENSFWLTLDLFKEYAKKVSSELFFIYPNDDEIIIDFIEKYYLKRKEK